MASFLSTPLGQWVGIIVSVLTGGFAQAMMKLGTRKIGQFGDTPALDYLWRLMTSPFILLAVVAYGLGVILYMLILSRLDLSYLYPVMTALGLVLASLVSTFVFGEHISLMRLGGIAVIIVGVFILAGS
ncbi:MAG: SMR family transporter [Anaerolineae bacterium]|jgi:multidrug transporter EmrE-like cation transporter